MKSFFKEIFEYQNEVNQDILNQLDDIEVPQKVLNLLSHCFNAHKLWNYRVLDNNEKVEFKTYSLDELKVLDNLNLKDTQLICEKGDLAKLIDYNSTSGKSYHNSIQEILTQVSQHFQYHRGQIISELINHNIQLKPTDYIYYSRNEV